MKTLVSTTGGLVVIFMALSCPQTFPMTALNSEHRLSVTDSLYDQFGGYRPIRGRATGRFRVQRIGKRDWLLTPDGHAFFSVGINHLSDAFSGQSPQQQKTAGDSLVPRLTRWHFNTLGYDSPPQFWDQKPFFVSVELTTTGHYLPTARFRFNDVFDPQFQQNVRTRIHAVCNRVARHPNLIGYYWTDTPEWDIDRARRHRHTDWVSAIRDQHPETAGYQAYLRFLRGRYPSVTALNRAYGVSFRTFPVQADSAWKHLDLRREAVRKDDRLFLGLIARTLYRTAAEAFRTADSAALLFGEKHKLYDHPMEVVQEESCFTDVVSIQPGPTTGPLPGQGRDETRFDGRTFDRLHRLTGKPVLICDHTTSFRSVTYPVTLWHQFATPDEVILSNRRFLLAAVSKPYVVGYQYCTYASRYKADRGLLKQGLLQTDDVPTDILATGTAQTNQLLLKQAYKRR